MIKWIRGFISGIFIAISMITIALMVICIGVLRELNEPIRYSGNYSTTRKRER